MCLVIFYLPGMQNDVACTLQLLSCTANAHNAADDPDVLDRKGCLNQRKFCVDLSIRHLTGPDSEDLKKRWNLFVFSMWAPLLVVIFECIVNRMVIKKSHISYQFIMWISYVFATFLGEVLMGYPVFPSSFDWQCSKDTVPDSNCWSNLIAMMLLMLALQCFFFGACYGAHKRRNNWLEKKWGNKPK